MYYNSLLFQFSHISKMSNNDLKLTIEEILLLQEKCMELIRSEELYEIRNSAKLRAVVSTQNYDEFK